MRIQIVGKNSSNRMKLIKNIEKVLESPKNTCDIQILEDDKYKTNLSCSKYSCAYNRW